MLDLIISPTAQFFTCFILFIFLSTQSIPYLSLDSLSLSLLASSTGLHRFCNDEQGKRAQ